MKQKLTITDKFNDYFTNYEDKTCTIEMIVDLEECCECDDYKKCGLCKLVEKGKLIDIGVDDDRKNNKSKNR